MNAAFNQHKASSRREVLRLEALSLLKDFANDLIGIEEIDALLWAVAERTISNLGWQDCVIYLMDPHRNVLIQKAAFGPKSIDYKSIFDPIEVPVGRGVVGKVASTGQAMRISDTSQFNDYIEDDAVRFSELAVPILWGQEVLGVIDSEHPERNFYQVEDQLILETVAGITATKIQNARSIQSNSELALFYERNPNPVLQLNEVGMVSFINESARRYFHEHLDVGSLLMLPKLKDALLTAKKKGRFTLRCNQTDPKTGEERTGEFNIVHLDAGQFNLYGSDISHIVDLQKAAEAANEAKSRFLSVMSHEIRTPLNAILGLTELLIDEEANREEQLRHLAYMEFSGRHLLSLVNDILDLEKMASGKVQGAPQPCNVIELSTNIVDSFQNRAENVGLELKLNIDPNLPRQLITEVRWLTQILNNLIGNAVKYTSTGTITLNVFVKNQNNQGCTVRFEVSDTGPGIPASELSRILQPFEQIQGTTQIEGTGLGLAIVQALITEMSGTLSIESEVNKGSTFSVELDLPRAENQSQLQDTIPSVDGPQDVQASPHTDHDNPSTILLADDNELNRFVANKLLTRWGYKVVEAVNGQEAVRAWEKHGPCLILMDVQMPLMDGLEATRIIRNNEATAGLKRSPILALTADAEPQTNEKIINVGMDERVIKPFNPVELQAIIASTIESLRNEG